MKDLKKSISIPQVTEQELEALMEKRNKAEMEGVERMSKHPLSWEQKLEQQERINQQIKAIKSIKNK